MDNIISSLIQSAENSCRQLRDSIRNVRQGPIIEINGVLRESFTFDIAGDFFKNGSFTGFLAGRNANYVLGGFGEEFDRRIAARVFLDGDLI